MCFLCRESLTNTHLGNNTKLIRNTHQCGESRYCSNYENLAWHMLSMTCHPTASRAKRTYNKSRAKLEHEQPAIRGCTAVCTVNKWSSRYVVCWEWISSESWTTILNSQHLANGIIPKREVDVKIWFKMWHMMKICCSSVTAGHGNVKIRALVANLPIYPGEIPHK